ncbi:hypothetical protein BpHYR1_043679 [Brachionus plicatilis]|uniref:Uncharacterized protein n=1 Tax=Brachionus plicatilis TaxID=10195 RepID=A0A3M7RQW2_BRAPC|nr:hypothetical protein BpHYR1_043679 [Brachionus plicatilis]
MEDSFLKIVMMERARVFRRSIMDTSLLIRFYQVQKGAGLKSNRYIAKAHSDTKKLFFLFPNFKRIKGILNLMINSKKTFSQAIDNRFLYLNFQKNSNNKFQITCYIRQVEN